MRWVWRAEQGGATLEYAVLVTMVATVAVALVATLTPAVDGISSSISSAVCSALGGDDCEEGTDAAGGGENSDGSQNAAGSGDGDTANGGEQGGAGEVGGDGSGSQEDGAGSGGDGADADADGAGGEGAEPGEDGSAESEDADDPGEHEEADAADLELAQALWDAEADMLLAEAELEDAEADLDDMWGELGDLLWEITGGADFERCFTEGNIGSCLMAIVTALPWTRLLKVGSKIPTMWRLFDRWRGARSLRNTRRTNLDNARGRHDRALEACGSSFAPGTPVLMGDGTRQPIETVEVGDEVYSFDPLTGDEGPREVMGLLGGEGEQTLVEVEVADRAGGTETVLATDTHPFWEPELAAWVDAADLEPGASLRTDCGEWVEVEAVESRTAYDQPVHNLTVAAPHTYYVAAGEAEILVHNANPADPCRWGIGGRAPKANSWRATNAGTFNKREDAISAARRDRANNANSRVREECSPDKCHVHLDIYNKKGELLETKHYAYQKK